MNNNNRKTNAYTQGQRLAVGVFIISLLAGLGSVLAVPKSLEASHKVKAWVVSVVEGSCLQETIERILIRADSEENIWETSIELESSVLLLRQAVENSGYDLLTIVQIIEKLPTIYGKYDDVRLDRCLGELLACLQDCVKKINEENFEVENAQEILEKAKTAKNNLAMYVLKHIPEETLEQFHAQSIENLWEQALSSETSTISILNTFEEIVDTLPDKKLRIFLGLADLILLFFSPSMDIQDLIIQKLYKLIEEFPWHTEVIADLEVLARAVDYIEIFDQESTILQELKQQVAERIEKINKKTREQYQQQKREQSKSKGLLERVCETFFRLLGED